MIVYYSLSFGHLPPGYPINGKERKKGKIVIDLALTAISRFLSRCLPLAAIFSFNLYFPCLLNSASCLLDSQGVVVVVVVGVAVVVAGMLKRGIELVHGVVVVHGAVVIPEL